MEGTLSMDLCTFSWTLSHRRRSQNHTSGLGGGDAVDGDGHTSMKGRHIRKSEEPITRAEIGASCVDYYMSQYLAA